MRLGELFNDRNENIRNKVIGIYILLTIANIAAWVWAIVAFHDFPVLLGTAALAYSFGLRHAFDADHIASIDNVTRKLIQEGRRPVGVGLFFSLGHSTIVVALSIALAITATALQNRFDMFKSVGGIIGTAVSAQFLFAIAVANVFVLISIYRAFQTVKNGGQFVEEDLNLMLAKRGLLGRMFRCLFRVIERSWQMYPLGVLFGLGFDTATEVGLLDLRDASVARLADLVDFGVSGAVYGRHDLDRYDRQHPDARCLWLGLRQTDPQALLQPDDYGGVGNRRHRGRRSRDAEPDWRSAGTDRRWRRLGRGRIAKRQFWRPRLSDRRHLHCCLACLLRCLPRQSLRRDRGVRLISVC